MYRSYEDPYRLEEQLKEVQADLEIAYRENDWDRAISLSETEHELKERINFAWQDDEYDSYYA